MARWMCGVSLCKRNEENLMMRLGVEEVLDVVRRGWLTWFGHVEQKEEDDWVSACRNIKVPVLEAEIYLRKHGWSVWIMI